MKNDRTPFVSLALALLLAAASAVPARAQYSQAYYHLLGDTIYLDSPIYYHNWWGFENSLQTRQIVTLGHTHALSQTSPTRYPNPPDPDYIRLGGERMLSYCFTAQPLRVIGLAHLCPQGYLRYPFNYPYADTTHRQEYIYLYEADTASLRELAAVPWHYRDMFDSLRYLYVRGAYWYTRQYDPSNIGGNYADWNNYYQCCGDSMWEFTFRLREYYFDSAIVVQDSFYIGYSDYSYVYAYDDPAGYAQYAQSRSPMYMFARDPVSTTNCEGTVGDALTTGVCGVYWPSVFFRYPYSCDSAMPPIRYENHWKIPMIFPIIEVDTTVPPPDYCPAVSNLQVARDENGCVVATWDAFVNHTNGYEIQYGLRTQDYDQWQTVFSSTNFAQVCDLNPVLGYGLRVRPVCENKRVGPWQERYFFIPGQLPVGIEDEPSSDLARHTRVAPNPAKDAVTVSSDYGILGLDLYDLQGRHLLNDNLGSREATLDLSALPEGTYILQVSTPAGTTTKRIVKR